MYKSANLLWWWLLLLLLLWLLLLLLLLLRIVKRQRLELREVSLVEVEAGVHDLLLDGTELGRRGVGVGELLALPAKRVGAGAGLCFYAKGGGRQDGLQHVDKLNKNNNSLSLSLSLSLQATDLCLCFLAMLGARGGHVIWHADVWFSTVNA